MQDFYIHLAGERFTVFFIYKIFASFCYNSTVYSCSQADF